MFPYLEVIKKLTDLVKTTPEEDFILIKYLVKALIGYFPYRNFLFYESKDCKKILEQAFPLHDILIKKFGYSKYVAHLDFYRMSSVDDFMDLDEFGKLSRKYINSQSNPTWNIRLREVVIQRL